MLQTTPHGIKVDEFFYGNSYLWNLSPLEIELSIISDLGFERYAEVTKCTNIRQLIKEKSKRNEPCEVVGTRSHQGANL